MPPSATQQKIAKQMKPLLTGAANGVAHATKLLEEWATRDADAPGGHELEDAAFALRLAALRCEEAALFLGGHRRRY